MLLAGSQSAFAAQNCLSTGYVSDVLAGRREPGLKILRALGVEEDMAHTSIRFGIGRFTTDAEVDYAIQTCVKHVERLRQMSPLWEMVQEGIDLRTIKWSSH